MNYLHEFAVNKILMYSNIMSTNYSTATDAANSITQLYSDQFSQSYNETIDALIKWDDIDKAKTEIRAAEEMSINAENKTPLDPLKINSQNVNIRKTFYENQSIQYLYNWNKLLHLIYYFLAICLVISLFLSPNSFSIFAQVAVAAAVLLYPYYSVYVVKHVMKFYSDISTLLPKNVYTHYSDKHNYFTPSSVPK
jgi:hypothetical protein